MNGPTIESGPFEPSKLNFNFWRQDARKRSASAIRSPYPQVSPTGQYSSSSPHLPMAVAPSLLIPPNTDTNNSSDPKTPSTSSTVSRNDSVLDEKDVHDQLTKLSDKLVNAINHQTSLDDSLQQTRHDLEIARKTIADLETKAKEHAAMIGNGLLLTREHVQKTEAKMVMDLQQEKESRTRAEREKKDMEQELETLTSALFQEANNMVADARRDREASEKKNEQLRNQLRDAEILLESQQQQLQDLKVVLERMTEPDESLPSAPSTPAKPERMSRFLENPPITGDDTPDAPLQFNHLLQPVLRTDIQAYDDFVSVIQAAKAASPAPSRVASGSFGSLTVPPSLTTVQVGSAKPAPPALPTVRETKLFKRAVTEDIEPTLRLDIAPGVSWMVRRTVMNSIVDGSLVVEPMPPSPVKFRGPVNPCSLCGENRIGELYERKHRFRISEDKETKRFPLCDLCLGRLRSCCDLMSFLRMVANGHWKADGDDELKSTWEEYVKLREKMFWHRMSGGVIPVRKPDDVEVPRTSEDSPTQFNDIQPNHTADDPVPSPPETGPAIPGAF